MKATEILESVKKGAKITKRSYTKFRGNKIVRGSFYDYYCDEVKITEKQFDNILHRLKRDHDASTLSNVVYTFNI